ncbi:MAG: hypothetical protein LBU14_03775 [Candidatus Peribacteria bacterium]|jgi:hypothetical protein|nr:hypothetical protein [Candidatus Peribacteria bacterium]
MEKQLKQQILTELNSPNFPNLSLIYDNQSLDFALEILNEELAKEKKKFKDLLKIKNEDLTFESFENDGILDYYWSLLNHLENIDSNEKIRKIIETFRPKLQDF